MRTYPDEGYSPSETTELVGQMLELSSEQQTSLLRVLDSTDEDPVLVIRLNQTWVNSFGLPLANQILDAIATYNLEAGQERRDHQAPHFCFHFAYGRDIVKCRRFIQNIPAYKDAFCPSPESIAHLAKFDINYPGNREPMGFGAMIYKFGVRHDDPQQYNFFYL